MTTIQIPNDLWDDDSIGVISTWLFETGDMISQGDTVAEVMVEKTSFDIIAPASGKLIIGSAVESEVSLGDTIAKIEAG